MNREQLAHVVRAAATITGDGDIVIIGSQAFLGTADVGRLPEEATMSMEADVAFRDDVDASKADAVDGAIGELSQFHETYGYYAQGVEIRTAVLPAGWEDRAEILDRPDSRPGYARPLPGTARSRRVEARRRAREGHHVRNRPDRARLRGCGHLARTSGAAGPAERGDPTGSRLGGAQSHPFVLAPSGLAEPDRPMVGARSVHDLFTHWLADVQGRDAERVGRGSSDS